MATKVLKYKINQQIDLLPREISIADVVETLKKEGVSKFTFYRDRNMTVKSTASIPTDRLLIYAKLFECSIDDLLVKTETKVKSIRQRFGKQPTRRKIKNGLS